MIRLASFPNLIASQPSIPNRIARPTKTAEINRTVLSLNTPAHKTNGLNGKGGGSIAGTITATRSYRPRRFSIRLRRFSDTRLSPATPARLAIRYNTVQPIADPQVAANA